VSGPIAATALWRRVIGAAGGVCQCTGSCGTRHRDGRGKPCSVAQGEASRRGPVKLIAAPADAALSVLQAACLPAERLRAWCPACWSAIAATARTAAREAASVPQEDALF